MLKSLHHKNIVNILRCYTLPNMQVVFIMEYLEGGELLDYVTQKGRLSEFEAREFFQQIVDAIAYCHKEKLIHRDLKLENIMLLNKTSKTIKIVDFGICYFINIVEFLLPLFLRMHCDSLFLLLRYMQFNVIFTLITNRNSMWKMVS